ncbi:toll-like receptor 4 [Ylistrum balloti]|uniref:toll-like receptor 4 n=1 Tax=Ylistrum balloti TaxID=509963 RepID=UPI002905C6EA|nr:toll-like receptor 4 [Ylistrum balloti]
MASSAHDCVLKKHSTYAYCSGLGLTSIPKDLPPRVIHLDVSHNPIGVLQNASFKHLIHLEVLFLEGCSLRKLEQQAFQGLVNLSELSLDSNRFVQDSFPLRVFEPLQNLVSISLKSFPFSFVTHEINRLRKLRSLKVQSPDTLTTGLSLNALYGLPLPSIRLLDLSSQVIPLRTCSMSKEVNVDRTSSGLSSKLGKTLGLSSLNSRHGTADIYAPPSLKVVNISHFTAKNMDLFDVIVVHNNTLEVLDLTSTQLATTCKQTLAGLSKLKHLNVSCLDCSSLSGSIFHGYSSLEELVFRYSKLDVGLSDEVSKELLRGLTVLKNVDFAGNKLEKLQDNLFISQRRTLNGLNLAENLFTGIPYNLSDLTHLKTLDLTLNRISSLDEKDRLMLGVHYVKVPGFRVLLAGNPFECNCRTVRFIEWVFTTKMDLDDPINYACIDRTGVNVKMTAFYQSLDTFKESCIDRTWLIFSICATFICILVVVTVAVGYRYRVSIRYCCLVIRRRYRGYHNIQGDTTQYKYDAFIAYNYKDYKFVRYELLEHLEKRVNLKLCLHHRDFPPGVDITDNIMDAIDVSKYIIIVITKSYLSSSWGKFELEMSRRHIFQRNSDNLIVIMLEEIDKINMPKKLYRIYNQITCLEHPGRKNYSEWKDSGYDEDDTQLFWKYLQDTLQT